MDAQESRCKGGNGKHKSITLEKDQPLHVRLRSARLRRFQMQDTAARLAGNYLNRKNRMQPDRVANCLRRLSDVASGVELRYNPASRSAHYRGLQTCGSVWHCPVCAAKISETRRDELARLVSAHIAAAGFGLSMNAHGFQIDRTFGAVKDYITKFGHEPANARPWGVENEVSKGHLKQARDEDGMTPFALLAAISDGLEKYASLWQEYCRVFKGRKQLNYSSGLKDLYGIKEKSDEEITLQGEVIQYAEHRELRGNSGEAG